MDDFWICMMTGFCAQLVDGALGMAYGVTASSLMLAQGFPPAAASATVHASECFTTGASAISHHQFGNVDARLFRKLLFPGMLGAVLGACVLTSLPGEALRPYVSAYLLLMGLAIIVKAFRQFPPPSVTTHVPSLGFIGGFLDSIGGGGWGPIVTSNLVLKGNSARMAVGSVNASEFFVTVASTAAFVSTLGLGNWRMVAGLAAGGLVAAPLGAWVCKRVHARHMMIVVGSVVAALSLRTLVKFLVP